MINTVLQTIEKFETSMGYEESPGFDLSSELETSVVPTIALENIESDDASVREYTDEDTSDDSDDFKESVVSEKLPFLTDPDQIKQTLKDKIRIRRESEGAGEITKFDLFGPPVQYQLTEEEEKKNELRKQRNRRSANKSRLKRIAYEKKLERDASDLEQEHSKLSKEVEEMKKMKLIYYQILKQHLQTSCQRVSEAQKQRLSQRKPTSTDNNSSIMSAVSTHNGSVSQNTGLRLNNQLITSHRESQLPQYPQQPSSFHSGMKRNITDGVSMVPAKIPKLWSTPSQSSNIDLQSAQETTQSCTNNGFSSVSTTIADSDNQICEMPINCTTIQTPFCGTNYHCPPVYTSTVCSSANLARKADMKTHVTEEQKINQIKEHLLDGFDMAAER